MFTGIVEEIGRIEGIQRGGSSSKLRITGKRIFEDIQVGDSIAVNGVCLTVTEYKENVFHCDVMAETLRCSNLGDLAQGSGVNLERAMAVGSRFSGHIVSGHIDGMGKITSFQREGNAVWVKVTADAQLLKYIIKKGSIAIDGVSLTVAVLEKGHFSVSIIPHTKEQTMLLHKKIGDRVNLECDVIGKYVERLLFGEEAREEMELKDVCLNNRNKGRTQAVKQGILSREFLMDHGF